MKVEDVVEAFKKAEKYDKIVSIIKGEEEREPIRLPSPRTVLKDFPKVKKANPLPGLKWVLETYGRPVLKAVLSKAFEKEAGFSPGQLLKQTKSGELVCGLYKDNPRMPYYGLPEWTEGTGHNKRWKPEFYPEGVEKDAKWRFTG